MKKIKLFSALAGFFVLAAGNEAYSQCSYVTKGTSHDTTISIACDFPVFEDSASQVLFNYYINTWDASNPDLKFSAMMSLMEDGKAYIEIEASEFKKYSTARQTAIKAESYFKIKE